MNATQVLDLLILGRALQEAGRCQGPWATDGEYEVNLTSRAATHYCAAGALHFAAHVLEIPTGTPEQQKARHLLSEAAREFLKGRELVHFIRMEIERKGSTMNFAILANDRMELTDAEMLSIWDDAAAMVNPK